MSYFEDVYLPRINRFGDTLQDRIQGKREHDFIVMMNKSPNKVEVREVNPWAGDTSLYNGVLQTKEYDEDEIQNYLLVPCDRKVPMGYLLYFTDVRRDVEREKPFMAYAEDPYTTAGYNRYTVVELEETLDWIVDGVPYSSPVHATGGGSGARDKNINLKFRVQFSEAGVYLPNKRYSLIMPYNEAIKKNHRVTLGGETWRITGFDKISVSGVMYLTLEEALTDVNDDNPIANYDEYENWSFSFNTGETYEVDSGGTFNRPCIYAYYKQKPPEIPVQLEITYDNTLIGILVVGGGSLNNYTPGTLLQIQKKATAGYYATGDVDINIRIKGAPLESIYKLKVIVKAGYQAANHGITGPDIIHMGDIIDYTFYGLDVSNALIQGDCAEITNIDPESRIVSIKGDKIGKAIIASDDTENAITKEVEVISLWLGGKDNVDS